MGQGRWPAQWNMTMDRGNVCKEACEGDVKTWNLDVYQTKYEENSIWIDHLAIQVLSEHSKEKITKF